jgi:GR25 family glycosyltransferase involved in LPS biosynthesis
MQVDRVVVLSLARRPDRLESFWKGFPARWPFPRPDVVAAVDGLTVFLPPPWRGSGAGAHGCWLTHLKVLRQAYADGVEELLVLEDDATFLPRFAHRAAQFCRELPVDWRMVMLGGQHVQPAVERSRHVVRCRDTQRTHAYVIRRSAMPCLLAIWGGATGHLDFYLPRFQERMITYAPRPFLVGQAAGSSEVTGHREDLRFWNQTEPGPSGCTDGPGNPPRWRGRSVRH